MIPRTTINQRARRAFAASVIALALGGASAGCGSGSDSGSDPITGGLVASFAPSGTAATPNGIRVTGTAAGDEVLVEVRIAGNTSSNDLYAFSFDLVLGDPTVAQFVTGSAQAGNALTANGSQSVQVLASQSASRVTLGVSKVGGGPGNGVGAASEPVLVSLRFRVLKPGSTALTFEGSPPNPAAALDSSASTIPSIQFDTQPAAIVGS